MPARPAISPTAKKAIPVFAASFTSALTRGAPVAFIATMAQSPPDTFHVVGIWPRPVLDASQKCCEPGGLAGAPPGCRY
jgi:hypothetical protein